MSICFIVNPTAGKGKGKIVAGNIHSYMKKQKIPYEIRFTTRRKEAEQLAQCAVKQGFDKIVSVGGDGTIYEVLNGIMGMNVLLGVIPAGTGNDFVRTVGIGQDIEEALHTVVYGKERSIDCGKVNGRYYINVAGIGFDTEVLEEVESIKKYLSGKLAYLSGVFRTLFQYKFKKIQIVIDGQVYNKEILLVAFANGKFYGGGMKISPGSDIQDGYIDVCIIHKMPKWKILRLFPTIFSGEHIKVKEVTMYRGKEIRINSALPLAINLDGDLVGYTPFTLEVIPNAIKILVP